jgi:hypothetical protein
VLLFFSAADWSKTGEALMAVSDASRILQAAISLLAERGRSGVTVKEIARRAKVPQGAIYRIFRTKRNLLDCAEGACLAVSPGPECAFIFEAVPSSLFSGMGQLSIIKHFTIVNNILVCYINALHQLGRSR